LTNGSNKGGVSEREINIALVVKKSSPWLFDEPSREL
jgi:hypothetical protein